MGPRTEGLELVRVIRGDDRLKATPVIILSGMVNPSPAYEAGANAFVSKCADLDTFFARVRDLMHFWLNVAELPVHSPTIFQRLTNLPPASVRLMDR
jgi:two-component system response regulator